MFSEANSNWADLSDRVSVLYNHMLPAIATPAALIRLDTAPDRGARVVKEAERCRQAELAASEA
jgi:hypothetical protein